MSNVSHESADARSNLETLYQSDTKYGAKLHRREAKKRKTQVLCSTKIIQQQPSLIPSFLIGIGISALVAGTLCVSGGMTEQTQQVLSTTFPPPPPIIYENRQEHAISILQSIPGMHAEKSVITGIVDPLSLSAAYYWTFTIKNDSREAHETQFEIALPKGALVSRATLWINGVPQEAAFSSTQQVTQAYEWITVSHRDPLLVTQLGPGRILVKASPVQPGGQPMQLRLGITAPMSLNSAGQAQVMLPHMTASNTAIDCQQDIHIESPLALYSSEASARTTPAAHNGSILKANIDLHKLSNVNITAARPWSLSQYATRATHSTPSGYIVAKLKYDSQTGLSSPSFTKVTTLPDKYLILDEDVAHRLSTLWAGQEIDRLVTNGYSINQAIDLANTYRIVSAVSGATVLETEADYQHTQLNRNMYRSLSYTTNGARPTENPDAFNQNYFGQAISSPVAPTLGGGTINTIGPAASGPAASGPSAPILAGATNGTVGPASMGSSAGSTNPQGMDAPPLQGVNSASSIRIPPSILDPYRLSGLLGAPIFASTINAAPLLAIILMFIAGAWTFAGPVTLLAEAIKRKLENQPAAFKPVLFSALWLGIALTLPSISQLICAILAVQLLFEYGQKRFKKPRATVTQE